MTGILVLRPLPAASVTGFRADSPKISDIVERAHQGAIFRGFEFHSMLVVDLELLDGIDLPSVPFVEAAFKSIEDISR